jgi:long-chain acyl-CoA synthetase
VIPIFQLTPADVALTFLPLSHSFERLVVYAYLMAGLTIVFAENLDTIMRDLRTTSPTLMTVVPRVCEKLQARADLGRGASAPRRWLFGPHWRVRWLVRRTGGASPGADGWRDGSVIGWSSPERAPRRTAAPHRDQPPLQRETGEFFSPGCRSELRADRDRADLAVNHPGRSRLGTVSPGSRASSCIAEDGEISRGSERDAGTEPAGRYRGGDPRRLVPHRRHRRAEPDGFLCITDRKKDLLVTSGQEGAPQPIEARLKQHPLSPRRWWSATGASRPR